MRFVVKKTHVWAARPPDTQETQTNRNSNARNDVGSGPNERVLVVLESWKNDDNASLRSLQVKIDGTTQEELVKKNYHKYNFHTHGNKPSSFFFL